MRRLIEISNTHTHRRHYTVHKHTQVISLTRLYRGIPRTGILEVTLLLNHLSRVSKYRRVGDFIHRILYTVQDQYHLARLSIYNYTRVPVISYDIYTYNWQWKIPLDLLRASPLNNANRSPNAGWVFRIQYTPIPSDRPTIHTVSIFTFYNSNRTINQIKK